MGAVSGGRRMGGAGRSLVLRKSGGRRQSAELPESAGSVLKGRPSQSGGACGAGTCGILADDAAREKMQMEPLLAEFYDDTQQEPEKEKRCRRYLAVAGMYFSFSEELARENDTDAMRKGIEVLEKAAGENMEGQWEAVIWQRLADACYLGGKSGEREQDWCQESFLYYERLLCSRQDGNRRKNLLRAAELALQFDMQEKAEQYLNEAAEILGMEEDIFYQQIRKRWEEAR